MQDFTIDQPMECVAENIYPLLDRAVELAAAGFARDVRLVRQYDPSLPFAEINGDAFVQVMLNLLKNAAEALEGMEQRSEEHTSELQSLMRISYAVFCLNTKHP